MKLKIVLVDGSVHIAYIDNNELSKIKNGDTWWIETFKNIRINCKYIIAYKELEMEDCDYE